MNKPTANCGAPIPVGHTEPTPPRIFLYLQPGTAAASSSSLHIPPHQQVDTMAPKTKAPAAAKENVTLGPLAGDGMRTILQFSASVLGESILTSISLQASSFSALPVSSPPSTIPSFTLPISRSSSCVSENFFENNS